MDWDMQSVRRVAREAALSAGNILLEGYSREIKISYKGTIDLVTEIDWASEKEIVRLIRSRFPEHSILGEEGGVLAGPGTERWIIDPLDGTTNYRHFRPSGGFVSVSDCPGVGTPSFPTGFSARLLWNWTGRIHPFPLCFNFSGTIARLPPISGLVSDRFRRMDRSFCHCPQPDTGWPAGRKSFSVCFLETTHPSIYMDCYTRDFGMDGLFLLGRLVGLVPFCPFDGAKTFSCV